ncbi:MAG: PBP1A family penicillin-binding protein [Myxococcota bacterium]|nr:PBP1A family penicillin-binding protein [Myxococcota bacterium]
MEENRPPIDVPPASRGRSRVWKWLKRLMVTLITGLVLMAAVAVGTYLYFERDLPSVEALRTYQPPQVTKVYCAQGDLCAEYYNERRTWVELATLPPHVKNAFLAAEDADFYKHEGLDYVGMIRAGVMGLLPGRRMAGASTITQQAVKNLLLSQERSASRKIREWILTPRVEQALTKEQILALYVNQIYFGHNRYGIEEAALFYFGKHAKDLSIGEAAVLAGTPQLPHRINPLTNIVKAKKRQRYVLTQLARHGFLPEPTIAKELDKPIVLAPSPPDAVGPYYTEEIRRTLLARYGEQALYEGGMRVDIAMDTRLQAMADRGIREGLEAVDRRMGYQGPLGTLTPADFQSVRPHIVTRIEEAGKRRKDEVVVADLEPLIASAPQPEGEVEEGAEELPEQVEEGEAPPSREEIRAREVRLRPLKQDLRVAGMVTAVDDGAKKATVDLVGRTAELSFSTIGWARPRGVGKWTRTPAKISEVLALGMVVQLKITRLTPAPAPLEATLDQTPQVQGALVVIDPSNRQVVALAGGYDFLRSSFNRATQAKRQPGSAFKPFLYAAALASHQYTTISQVNDAPEAIRDPYTGKTWKPQNYEKGGFEGPMSLRTALTKSKNTVSVRLIEKLTPEAAIHFARRAGIRSDLPDNLTLALGTGEVKVLELTNAYATLHSLGQYAEPILLVRVTDRSGKILEEHQAAFEETMQPAVAYLATSLMQSVVEEGTARAVRELQRPAAGKTGTANEYRDAWFAGYTRDFVATAWVGFDDHASMGSSETGGSSALPVWLNFMREAHRDLPVREFEPPPGVTLVRIDPVTGLLAGDAVPGRLEPFLEGTAPTAMAPPPGQVSPDQFFLEDSRRGGM